MRKQLLIILLLIVQVSSAQSNVNELIDSLTIVSSHEEKARLGQKIAWELKNTDWLRTLHYIDYSIENAKNSNSKEVLAKTHIVAGKIFSDKDALDISLDYYLKAYSFYKNSNQEKENHSLEKNLAVIYARSQDYKKAHVFFKKAYQYSIVHNDSNFMAKILNNLGRLYLLENNDSSLIYFQKGMKISEKLDDNELSVKMNNNIGRYYSMHNNPKMAEFHYHKAIKIIKKGVSAKLEAWVYASLADHFYDTNKADSAIKYGTISVNLLENMTYSFENKNAVSTLYKSYLLNKNYENAANYFVIYDKIRDSLNTEKTAANIEKLKLDQEYKVKNKIKTLEESKNRSKYFVYVLSLISILLILIITLIHYRNKLSKSRLEKNLLEVKRKELDANLELKNKELIVKAMTEIHRSEITEDILSDLKHLKLKTVKNETQETIDHILKRLEQETKQNIWEEFELHFEQVHESFYMSLNEKHPDLTSRDKRLCALLKLNLTSKEIAQITGQSFKSVENARTRLRKKLNLTNTSIELTTYIFNI